MISTHRFDSERCTRCGVCQSLCPVGAIDIGRQEINHSRCIACFGCLNNCPAQAIDMRFLGSRLTGFFAFLQERSIVIQEPAELSI
ncbi:MAG: 4Fe-4S binding protein [Spirochaetes bacterium]|nr:4Fe-4S binding protein [Spirochaetota bacterium]